MRLRAALDVAGLPDIAVDSREPIWWGSIGMLVIEGTMFALAIASYFYLRIQVPEWPPEGVELPDLPIPTGSLAVLLLALVPAVWMDRAALADDARRMRLGLIACLVLALAAMYLRGWEFIEQDVRWDENAYGSVVWTLLGLHAGHLLAVAGETLFLLVVARRGDQVDDHHRLDMRTLAVYWYFVVGSWVLIYGVIYLSPRLIGRLDLGGPG